MVGEALVDLVAGPGDDTIRALAGGSPFNTARGLARLGVPVRFIGRLSGDPFGARLRATLEGDGVDVAGAPGDEPTTLAVAQVDADGAASYRFYLDGTSAFGLDAGELRRHLPERLALLHVGSLALVRDPIGAAVESVVPEVAGRAAVTVDPNIRPSVIGDAVEFRRRLAVVVAHADLVKVSEDDLAWLDPGHDPHDAAADLLGLGPRAVLLTMGDRGAVAITASSRSAVAAVAVRVADTVGAGDAFTAGALAWWHEHGADRSALADPEVLRAACEQGVRAAAIACSRAGADPPRREDLLPAAGPVRPDP